MKTCKLSLALLAGLLSCVPAYATSVTAGGGDGSVGIDFGVPLSSGLRADLGYLKTEDRRGDANIYSAALMIVPASRDIHWEVGARYQYQDARYGSGGGVGLGGSLDIPTGIRWLSIGGYGFYTPSGLTNGDMDHGYDYGAQLRVWINSSFSLYGGYRHMRTTFDYAGSRDLYKGPMFGIRVGL
ncbi:YfaZ family outer membrane protein [Dyella sp. ASV21]|uniref:YfaZ family outer membrane protein n=1 Tax=Dyella sp. ASV21 TaxID=2795114 RepID=UPI0018EB28C5|nr:YfaZ family outer membrane protein [Dyella sp. ASV21]